jgi:uncharacterized protein
MTNSDLISYVKAQLEQGKNKDEIKTELLGAGWSASDINEALGIPNPAKPPSPPSPRPVVAPTATGVQHLDPKAVILFFFRSLFAVLFITIWLGFGLIAAVSETLTGALGIGLVVFFVILILAFVWAKLSYYFYRYELTEEGFRKELGVILKKYVTIPYERIQNINVNRGILDRILGLSTLNIFTAGTASLGGRYGGGGAEGNLPGLSREMAEQLRTELIHRSRQAKSQGF